MAARCALSGLRNPIYQPVNLFRRPAQAQRRRAICTRLRSRHCAGWRLTPYPAYGALYINRLLCFVGPRKRRAAGQAVSGAFPSLCRMAATPYPAYGRLLNLSYQTVAQLCRPAQAQRRRAGCIQRYSPRFAGWRLRLIRPTEGC
ncbi:TPA: hypothetical protein MFN42_004044 [Klebsiella quasipneumoniae subsp. quasipneumoniae]|nr:hypothetical protein [Klebsiella quasipneumoniae subsp. quasipneumoniae]